MNVQKQAAHEDWLQAREKSIVADASKAKAFDEKLTAWRVV